MLSSRKDEEVSRIIAFVLVSRAELTSKFIDQDAPHLSVLLAYIHGFPPTSAALKFVLFRSLLIKLFLNDDHNLQLYALMVDDSFSRDSLA